MKTDKSSNSHEDSRKVYHPEDHEKMKESSKLQGRNTGDGREGEYKIDNMTDEEKTDEQVSSNDITGKKDQESDQEDVKKEFEIRSGKSEDEMSKSEDGMSKKREKDPVAESGEFEKEKEGSGAGWQKSYKGDAEL